MIAGILCLGHEAAAAVTLPALTAQDSQTATVSPEPLLSFSGLTDAASLEVALLGDESGEENAAFDAVIDAPVAAASAPADTLEDFLTREDGYPMMSSSRGLESSGSGHGWRGSVVGAGIAAGILEAQSNRHGDHGFSFGNPITPRNPGIPSSTPSIGSDDTPGSLPADVPEPGTLALLAAGIAIALRRRSTRA